MDYVRLSMDLSVHEFDYREEAQQYTASKEMVGHRLDCRCKATIGTIGINATVR